jgi:hypothetical protein
MDAEFAEVRRAYLLLITRVMPDVSGALKLVNRPSRVIDHFS